jgi:hypothetical protein
MLVFRFNPLIIYITQIYKLGYLILPGLFSNNFFSKILNNLACKRLLTISYSIDMINKGFFLIFGKVLDLF